MSILTTLNNVRIGTKIGGGFAIVLVLLATVSGVGYFGLNKADTNFVGYQDSARQRNQLNRVAYAMQRVRVNVRNFILDPSDAASKQTFDRLELVQKEIEAAKGRMASRADLIPQVDKLDGWNKDWKKEFQNVVNMQDERNKQVRDGMDKIGPAMDDTLNALMESLKKNDNAEGVFLASRTLRHLLLARMYVQRFLRTNADVEAEQMRKEMAALDKARNDLEKAVSRAEDKVFLAKLDTDGKAYVAAWEGAYKAISARNEAFKVKMTQLGDNMVKTGDDLTNTLRDFQEKLDKQAEADQQRTMIVTLVVTAVAFVLGILAAWVIGAGISRPVVAMTEAMGRLAGGDLDVEVPARDHKDEIGSMATSVQVFKDNAIEKVRLEAEQEEKERRAKEEKRQAMLNLAESFEVSVGQVVSQVSSAATEMQSSSEAMSATAEETTRQASAVAAASEQASANVQTVASAAEELSSSIAEISRQVTQASQIASAAVKEAEQTNVKVQGLADAANKIGEVVALITDIAEQTNLLALNATIEAARAGDAGKGFAVVASEVKNLANQTAKATDEIGAQITGIQAATREAVAAIDSITKTITKINEVNANVASAVEEQGAATQEIARNVEQASTGTQEVSSNISGVSQAANETGSAAEQIKGAAGELSHQSEKLRAEVNKFLANIRAA